MSLLYRIEELAGEPVSKENADNWLTDAARDLINILPPSCLPAVTTEKSDPDGTTGVALSSCRVIGAHKAGRRAREVRASERAQLTDSESLHMATELRPAFYRSAGKGYVLPGGGTIELASYPTVDDAESADTVTGLPNDLTHAAIIYAARRALHEKASSVRANLPTDLGLPTPPSAPPAPSVSYADATAANLSSTTISALPAVPTFTKVSPSLTFTNLDSWISDEDSEMAEAEAGKLRLQLEEFASQIQDELNETNTALANYQNEVQRIIEQAQIDAQKAAQEAQLTTDVDVQNKWRAIEADLAEYSQKLQTYQAELGAYAQQTGAEIQDFAQRVQRDGQTHNMLLAEIQALTAQYREIIQHFTANYA